MTSADNVGFTRDQMLSMGITLEHIDIAPIDVGASPEYFSHYRSVHEGVPEARFMVLVGMLK